MKKQLSLSPTRKPVRAQKAQVTQEVKNTEPLKDETPEVTEIDLDFEIDPKKTYRFETLEKSLNPRYQNLGANALAYDPSEKRYIELVYFPTAKSIFRDELDESYENIQPPSLGFWANEIVCIGEDIRKMEYLMNHPLYEHSPFRVYNKPPMYRLADKDVAEAIKAKKIATELRALKLVEETEIDDLRPVARTVFGITETSEQAIRNALSELAKKQKAGSEKKCAAEKIIESIDDHNMRRLFHVQSALDKGIITVDINTMRVSYTDGNVHIWHLLYKANPIQQLVDWSFTPGEGSQFYRDLKKKL